MKLLAIYSALLVQVFGVIAFNPPKGWTTTTHIEISNYQRVQLSHNSPEVIRQEVLDTNIIHLLAQAGGLSETDLATVQISRAPGRSWIDIFQIGKSDKAFRILTEQLRNYTRDRQEGHTKDFLLAAMTNRIEPSALMDANLRILATNRPSIPVSWLKLTGSGTTTNKAGQIAWHTFSTSVVKGQTVTNESKHIPQLDEVCRWVSYALVDGEIAWVYSLSFKADGSFHYIHETKYDAAEYDPRQKKLISDVEDEVRAEMKRNGISGFGSVHTFWRLKKEKLKAKGIAWRSPAELNPNRIYD